jgi:hypothetical protein
MGDVDDDITDVVRDVADVIDEVADVMHDVPDVIDEVADVVHDVADVNDDIADVNAETVDVDHDVADVVHDVRPWSCAENCLLTQLPPSPFHSNPGARAGIPPARRREEGIEVCQLRSDDSGPIDPASMLVSPSGRAGSRRSVASVPI